MVKPRLRSAAGAPALAGQALFLTPRTLADFFALQIDVLAAFGRGTLSPNSARRARITAKSSAASGLLTGVSHGTENLRARSRGEGAPHDAGEGAQPGGGKSGGLGLP